MTASRVGFPLCLLVVAWPAAVQGRFDPVGPNQVDFAPVEARFVRVVILEGIGGQPCIDELEIRGSEDGPNLALASAGAKARASSLLEGHAIHQVAHLNDGLYGNSHSWIAAGVRDEWAEIELPRPEVVASVSFSRDREGRYADRVPRKIEVRVSLDGEVWTTVARATGSPELPEGTPTEEELLRYAFACEELSRRRIAPGDSTGRVLEELESVMRRLEARGLDVSSERRRLAALREAVAAAGGRSARAALRFEARRAKRDLFLRSPDLQGIQRVLFVKRHAFEPSHNYSVIFDAAGGPGGGICVLETPWVEGRLEPSRSSVRVLFESGEGIARDPVASFDGRRIYFGYRRSKSDYFHLMEMSADGGGLRQLTDGPFHDYYPCPLPDGGLAFVSTRCKARFLCWRPQAFVLFRMDADGTNLRPLSHANLSEWTPAVMRDGRILWMRSEYVDKGADFGHTLWSIRPDGTHPDLVFGNNTRNCYAGGREVPGSREILCTLVSHGGDLNGPLALIDPTLGRFNPLAIRSITPDVEPHYHMSWARSSCFRDPYPFSRDVYLASHAPDERFGLYIVDRHGSRELLYLDPSIDCMAPSPLGPTPRPPALRSPEVARAAETPGESQRDLGHFILQDVYRGLGPDVPRGRVRYLRVCQEIRADLIRLDSGEYQSDHEPFQDWYATPTHKVQGPHGWPSYVAKGALGLVPVEEDGSASFFAPSGQVLYFQALDDDLNEIQRMRSVVQLQAGETRGCIGCHEDRATAPAVGGIGLSALRREPSVLDPPPWGAGPFSYEAVVQPVWDARCVRCHDDRDPDGLRLTGTLDADGVPASYRTLIERGLVHYFDYTWGREHEKAPPRTFGTLRSRLWKVLEAGHEGVRLSRDEEHAVKCWIDLNCPLWPDYRFRPDRLRVAESRG